MSIQQEFNDAYWASQNIPIQNLRELTPSDGRVTAALDLASKGYSIDLPIMGWGWDPYQVMLLRQQYGYTWVPAALQPPVAMAPGLNTPGLAVYDANNPPRGSLKVSTDPMQFPPFVPPQVVVHPTEPLSLVGFDEGAGYFSALPAAKDKLTDGQSYTTDPRGIFTFIRKETPFGVTMFFKKV